MSGNRILVVDDEELVLESLRMTLAYYGYTVETASGGSQALLKLEHAESEYGLVVTDRKMPKMTGDQLSARIKQQWPHLPVIMVTGYPPDCKPPGVDVVLLKPFSTAGLRATVEALMNSRAEPKTG
jgi:CheY-like chemotaxis protein